MSAPSLAGVRRIAVFRALQLGDLLCAVPALRSLRHAAPQAHITLIGLPGAAGFVQRYAAYVDDLQVFPGMPGMPEQGAAPAAELVAFYADAARRRYDLAIQLHGSGTLTNPIVHQLGAPRVAGFTPHGPAQDDWLPWPDDRHEIRRLTALMQHLGIALDGEHLEFPLADTDRQSCDALLQTTGLVPARTVLVHPGARLPSRRWPAERYARVADGLAAQGWQIAVTGTEDERPVTRQLLALMATPAVDLTGATRLGALAALVAQCRLVVSNDTGISHIAAAVGTPSVVVASGSDTRRWAPLNAERHTVLSHDLPCRPCAHHVCPLPGHPCAQAITVEQVNFHVGRRLQAPRANRGPDSQDSLSANPGSRPASDYVQTIFNHLA